MSPGRFAAAVALATLAACRSTAPSEVVNVAFTISVDPDDYRSWDVDLESSEDFPVDWIDHDLIRETWVEAISEGLRELGFERVPRDEADFLVSYEFWVEESVRPDSAAARGKGSIVVRDALTGMFLMRATRKATVHPALAVDEIRTNVRRFVDRLIPYFTRVSEELTDA